MLRFIMAEVLCGTMNCTLTGYRQMQWSVGDDLRGLHHKI